ncbi:MAG: ATP-binding protein [Theionarchaea archaeon]|nr:ATP-binding protein [Theionarchaea archaeon]
MTLDPYLSTMYTKFQATFSNVTIIETADPRRMLETLNLYLKRNLKQWSFDILDHSVYSLIKELNKEGKRATESTIINKLLADESLKKYRVTVDKIIEIISRLKDGQHIKLTTPETYETGKELINTQILHYDAWPGLRVNLLRLPTQHPSTELEKAIEEALWEEFITDPEEKTSNGNGLLDGNELLEAMQRNQQATERMTLETALEKIDEQLKTKRTVCILTGIIPDPTGTNKSLRTLAEAVNSWAHDITIFNRKSFVVILTPSRSILPQSTLDNVIFLRPTSSTAEERRIIIDAIAQAYNIKPEVEYLVKSLAGLNQHQIATVLLESFLHTRKFETSFISQLKQEQVEKHGILKILNPNYGFERIGGYESIKNFIREGIINVLQNPELADELNLKPLRGVLLFGIWGSGKSLLAEALAHETHLPLFDFQPGNVMDKYVGESERKIREVVSMVEQNAPCILLIEETDSIGHRTSTDGDSGTNRRIFGELLRYMGDQKRKAIIIGTTNSPEFLDAAFLREGRFSPVPMLLPDFEARMAIFPVHLYVKRTIKTKFIEGPENPFEVFAEKTGGFTGAEIEGVVEAAQRIAFRQNRNYLTENDILTGIEGYQIDFEDRLRTQAMYIDMAERICRNKELLDELKREHLLFQKERIV